MSKVIYDLGANNGDDIPYYLMKADRVVAVEGNPVLCDLMRERFAQAIGDGRLIVENCVVTDGTDAPEVSFYIHRKDHVASQFPAPPAERASEFDEIRLPSKSVIDLIRRWDPPHYLKIDIEFYDYQILKAVFANGIFPPYLSSESHSVRIFALMASSGGYNAFKLVDGASVSQVYANRRIMTDHGEISFSFPEHSAGPYGEDIDGEWYSAEHFLKVLALEGVGWKDIHATNLPCTIRSKALTIPGHFNNMLKRTAKRISHRLTNGWRQSRRTMTDLL